MYTFQRKQSGLTFVSAIIAAAVVAIIFNGIFVGTRYSLELVAQSRAKLSALSLATDQMEFLRSLSYDEVGTIGGIPAGPVEQSSTVMLNGIEFTKRVLVEYVDDPADGQLTATTTDDNGIPADYKRVKVELTWNIYEQEDSLELVSNIVPRSIETTAGGGTIRINVIDQDALPLEGVTVRLINDELSPTIDTSRLTNSAGVALFSGAPAGSDYEVVVTEDEYSTDQTYQPTAEMPNPNTPPFAVLESDISTLTFQIDELSDIQFTALSGVVSESADEYFDDQSGIAVNDGVNVSGGDLLLANIDGDYVSSGTAYLTPLRPSPFEHWEAVTLVANVPGSTDYKVQFFTGTSGPSDLIENSELAGNEEGFTSQVIDLSELNPSVYPEIVVGITLETENSAFTPRIEEARVFYRESSSPLGSTNLTLRGNKTIGTDSSGGPIYKVELNQTTSGAGEAEFVDIEFDNYNFTLPSQYDLAYVCPSVPLNHRGGIDSELEIVTAANNSKSLQVAVTTDAGTPLPGATVSIEASGYQVSDETTGCGKAYLIGSPFNEEHILTVSKAGYETQVIDPLNLTSDSSTFVILSES